MPVALVAGAVANKPLNGGEAWVRMSWVLGLRRLGFDVCFVEAIDVASCVDAGGRRAPFELSVNREHFERVVSEFGLHGRAALLGEDGKTLLGMGDDELLAVAAEAEALFDLSGHLGARPLAALPRRRVYVDLDPGFTQAWHADPSLPFTVAGYDHHVTVGLRVGTPGCPIPVDGLTWIPTLPPIPLERWSGEAPGPSEPRFTTVSSWRSSHGAVEIDGRLASLKHHEFRRLIEMPRRVEEAQFELALDVHPADVADLEALEAHGWRVVSPRAVAGSPATFADYVRGSWAEFSVAQGVYVQSASGWFSDRTGAYLACGRPALVQDTGAGTVLPVGEGLLVFSSPEEAIEGARRLLADRSAHAQAARQIAEAHLDSDIVLSRLLDMLRLG